MVVSLRLTHLDSAEIGSAGQNQYVEELRQRALALGIVRGPNRAQDTYVQSTYRSSRLSSMI